MGRHDLHRAVIPPIHAAVPADRDAVTGLWAACGLTRPWNDPGADFDRAVLAMDADILVLHEQAALIGSVMVGWDGHRGWVYYLAVAPDRRRGGIGRHLMSAAQDWLIARGAPKIQLMVRDGNDAATAFYAALGFEPQPVQVLGRFLNGDDG